MPEHNNAREGRTLMSDTPTFGRYAEIPYDKMSPEQQEGYKSMIEARGRLRCEVDDIRLDNVVLG